MTRKFTGWHASSHSEAGGNCVEVGRSTSGSIGVRDSKLFDKSPILELTRNEWATLLKAIWSS